MLLLSLTHLLLHFNTGPLSNGLTFVQVYRAIKFYYIVESRTVWPNLWRVVNLIHILLILAHWFGCFYFLLSEVEGFQVSRARAKVHALSESGAHVGVEVG